MSQLILIRHGESEWNHQNRFTGWADIDLTETGILQMQELGAMLAFNQLVPDLAYTSRLRRCWRSHEVLAEAMGRKDIVATKDWRLNERHYGALTGLSKDDAARHHGAAAVQRWRRSFDALPPPIEPAKNHELLGNAYDDLPHFVAPIGESLEQVVIRVQPVWQELLLPALLSGKRTLVTAHGNSLRALVKLIEGISDNDIASLEVENARALVYTVGKDGRPTKVHSIASAILTPSKIL